MAYSEIDGKVVLTMSREDYDRLLMALGFASKMFTSRNVWVEFINRLNEGNREFHAYGTEKTDA